MKKRYLFLLFTLSVLLTACDKKVENKETSITINSQSISASFTGTLKSGKPDGTGSMSVNTENGTWTFDGNFKEGVIDGIGNLQDYPITALFSGNNYDGKYTGAALNGLPDGSGKFIYNSEDISVTYEGSWKEGKPSDDGHLISNNFTVPFKDVTRTGSFDGATVNGIANGQGTFTATNDEGLSYSYTGQWENNIFNGQGKYKNDNKETQNGTYINGEYQPTKAEYISYLGENCIPYYILSDKNKNFIELNANLFPASDESQIAQYMSTSFTYAEYSKNPLYSEEKLIDAGDNYVTQIYENDITNYGLDTLSVIGATDKFGNMYYIYYLGKLDGVLEGDIINVKGLPVGYTSFDNLDGGQTLCIAMLGSYIQKR